MMPGAAVAYVYARTGRLGFQFICLSNAPVGMFDLPSIELGFAPDAAAVRGIAWTIVALLDPIHLS